jgi:hypothetical protein
MSPRPLIGMTAQRGGEDERATRGRRAGPILERLPFGVVSEYAASGCACR